MNSKKLLIVDDEQGIRESLKEYLEFEGYEANVASCGEDALLLVRDNDFDLIISDIRMPKGDGKFLVQNLKQYKPNCPPLIFMSGFSDLTVEEAYNLGARGIISKPFSPQELLRHIQSLLLLKNTWSPYRNSHNEIELKIPTSNLETAVSQRKLNCGQYGFFISGEDPMPMVGDKVHIQFEDIELLGEGVVRWIRNYERSGKVKGFGVEFMKISDPLEKAIESFVTQNKVLSAIPINLKD